MKILLRQYWQTTRAVFLLLTGTAFLFCAGWFGIMGYQQAKTDYTSLAQQEYRFKKEMLQGTVTHYFSENIDLEENTKQEILMNQDRQNALLDDMIQARTAGDWKKELTLALEQAAAEEELAAMGVMTLPLNFNPQKIMNRYLLENEIQPKIPSNACDGLNVLRMYAEWMLFLLIALSSMLFAAMQFSVERQHGGMKLLLQMPFSRAKILSAKYLMSVMQTILCFVLVNSGLLLLYTLLFGFGDVRYPVARWDNSFIATGEFLLKMLPSALCSIFLFTALGLLLALCVQNEAVLIIWALAVPVFFMAVQTVAGPQLLQIPAFSSNISRALLETDVHFLLPCVGQLICAAVLGTVSIAVFQKRNLAK